MKIVINGAGVAGPALAYWLRRSGHDVTIIERADHFRTGGYLIDFWGLGYDLAERMGVLRRVREHGYVVQEVRFLRDDGRIAGNFSVDVFQRMTQGRFISLPRGDLAAAIYDAVKDEIDTRFDDSVAAIDQRDDGVTVTLESGETIDADLLIGADGLHSRVRELLLGASGQFERDLGYRVAAFTAPGYAPRDPDIYVTRSWPGRSISRFALADGSTMFLFIYASSHGTDQLPDTLADRKAALRHVFGGLGWETDAILQAVDDGNSLYLDRVSQIELPRWSQGRVALIGDAAACVSLLAGEGTGLAMVEAYVLAGELARAGGDNVRAFAEYERRLRPFLEAKQKSARGFAGTFAPKARLGITLRNLATRLLRFRFFANRMLGASVGDDFTLPEYDFDQPTQRRS